MPKKEKGRKARTTKDKPSEEVSVTPDGGKSKELASDILPKKRKKLKSSFYTKELSRLQIELIKLQEWIARKGLKVVVIFEGRDAAGKGGVIKRITQSLNPRICRVVALAKPTERELTQWYFQRDAAH